MEYRHHNLTNMNLPSKSKSIFNWRTKKLYIHERNLKISGIQIYTNFYELWTGFHFSFSLPRWKRLRWSRSRGSVLAFGTQVREFKPGRSRLIFQGEQIFSTSSFGREVKPLVPCRRFTACKRSLNVTWKSDIFRQNSSAITSPSSSSFHY